MHSCIEYTAYTCGLAYSIQDYEMLINKIMHGAVIDISYKTKDHGFEQPFHPQEIKLPTIA